MQQVPAHMTRRRPSGDFINDEDGNPVFVNTSLTVYDGQEHPIGFLYDQFNKPKQAPKRRRVIQRPKVRARANKRNRK